MYYEIPDELDFHLPGCDQVATPIHEDESHSYRQLVCWCNVQRYWYYVLHEPKVTDMEYDAIEEVVKNMESECEYLTNKYSPSKVAGSSRPEDYPKLIRGLFYGYKAA